ncbi:pilus assembly protein [Sphingomonas sp. QA11]|uniref:TadE/TadG family type IV pilus assembly protein n=1 Tax=Sphingomonas sp. QA11 TaxID=2950605 RepID=UPI00234BEAE7|nr:TadE/TadG family type IV pilus assembly protein [Sphingomonas sp. QA11]WCM28726.1 pilus assembly protein [Sphingomonas sp. QA11]
MKRLAALAARLRADRRGATIVEFAIVSPVMLLLLMGLGDMLYQQYAQSVLNGAVQKAARDSTIEAASTSTIDARVQTMIQTIAKNATLSSTRMSYDNFTEVAPEPFVDTNGNGIRDPGECYTDENGNNQWDADPGATGQGGASDVTLYTVTVTYPRLFPVAGLFGWPSTQTIKASTLLKNQPYAAQTTTANVTICT